MKLSIKNVLKQCYFSHHILVNSFKTNYRTWFIFLFQLPQSYTLQQRHHCRSSWSWPSGGSWRRPVHTDPPGVHCPPVIPRCSHFYRQHPGLWEPLPCLCARWLHRRGLWSLHSAPSRTLDGWSHGWGICEWGVRIHVSAGRMLVSETAASRGGEDGGVVQTDGTGWEGEWASRRQWVTLR